MEPFKALQVQTAQGQFKVQAYHLLVDTRQQMSMVCGKYGCTPIMYTEPVTVPYVFAFSEDRLFVWGFVEDLKKDPSDKVSRLGEAIHVAMQKN